MQLLEAWTILNIYDTRNERIDKFNNSDLKFLCIKLKAA